MKPSVFSLIFMLATINQLRKLISLWTHASLGICVRYSILGKCITVRPEFGGNRSHHIIIDTDPYHIYLRESINRGGIIDTCSKVY